MLLLLPVKAWCTTGSHYGMVVSAAYPTPDWACGFQLGLSRDCTQVQVVCYVWPCQVAGPLWSWRTCCSSLCLLVALCPGASRQVGPVSFSSALVPLLSRHPAICVVKWQGVRGILCSRCSVPCLCPGQLRRQGSPPPCLPQAVSTSSAQPQIHVTLHTAGVTRARG